MQQKPKITASGVLFFSLCTFGISACGHLKSRVSGEGGLVNVQAEGGLLGSPRLANNTDYEASLQQNIQGINIRNKNFDIPVVYNREVSQWITYFTGRGRKHFEVYLQRMGKMIPVMQPRLKAAGLPEDLIYLAMIESGFSTQAKSHASAVGPWQFMRSTGRMYNLESNWWIDERRDPIKATDSAIRYLTNLYNEFGSWELATAAYNSGEGRIRKAISRLKTKDFWTIARNRRALRRETKDYVPKMMAAAIIGKNAEQFGFEKPKVDTYWIETEFVKISKPTNLRNIAKAAGISTEELRVLNPELGRCCTPPSHNAISVRVPKGEAIAKLNSAIAAGDVGSSQDFSRHVIRKGDSLSRIAVRYKVPTEIILSLNDIQSARRLKVGTELLIPYDNSRGAKTSGRIVAAEQPRIYKKVVRAAHNNTLVPVNKSHVIYTVQKGDTLYDISRRYAVRVKDIKGWNDLSQHKNLRPGRRLKLYVRNEQQQPSS